MLWSVEASFRLNERGKYVLILYSTPLRMIAEVLTTVPVCNKDIIHPIENALYMINNKPSDTLKVTYAIEYSSNKWLSITKVS